MVESHCSLSESNPTSPSFLDVKIHLPDKESWAKWGFLDKFRILDHSSGTGTSHVLKSSSHLRLAVLTDANLFLARPEVAGKEAAQLVSTTDFDSLDAHSKQLVLDSIEDGGEALVSIPLHEITTYVYGGQVHELSKDEMTDLPAITKDSSLIDLSRGARAQAGLAHGLGALGDLHYRKDTKRVMLVTTEGDYHLQASCKDEAVAWGEAIEQAAQAWRQKLRRHWNRHHGPAEKCRVFVDDFYRNPYVQTGLAFIILCCFASSITVNTIERHGISNDPERKQYVLTVLSYLEIAFAIFFMLELLFNLAGSIRISDSLKLIKHDCKVWIMNGWNLIDVVVAVTSFACIFTEQDIGSVLYLRAVRVLRTIKIVKWFQNLRRLVHALIASIIPVASSLILMLLIVAVYSIFATQIFSQQSPEFFADFSDSFFSMLQMATGDSWASAITRSILNEDGTVSKAAIAFFSSYMVIVGTVLMNVVVAVLLDAFLAAMKELEEEANQHKAAKHAQQLAMKGGRRPCLEGLVSKLITFRTYEDLVSRISKTFDLMDVDGFGRLSREDINIGLQRLHLEPRVSVGVDDWLSITDNGRLCDGAGMLDHGAWHSVCWTQLHQYVLHLLSDSTDAGLGVEREVLSTEKALKFIMVSMQKDDESRGLSMRTPCQCVKATGTARSPDAREIEVEEEGGALPEAEVHKDKAHLTQLDRVEAMIAALGGQHKHQREMEEMGQRLQRIEARLEALAGSLAAGARSAEKDPRAADVGNGKPDRESVYPGQQRIEVDHQLGAVRLTSSKVGGAAAPLSGTSWSELEEEKDQDGTCPTSRHPPLPKDLASSSAPCTSARLTAPPARKRMVFGHLQGQTQSEALARAPPKHGSLLRHHRPQTDHILRPRSSHSPQPQRGHQSRSPRHQDERHLMVIARPKSQPAQHQGARHRSPEVPDRFFEVPEVQPPQHGGPDHVYQNLSGFHSDAQHRGQLHTRQDLMSNGARRHTRQGGIEGGGEPPTVRAKAELGHLSRQVWRSEVVTTRD